MKPGELIEMCIKGYKAYNPNKMTIDAHLEVFLAEIGCKDEGDSVFIKQASRNQSTASALNQYKAAHIILPSRQVIYGCLRFKKLNKVTLTALYFKHSSQVTPPFATASTKAPSVPFFILPWFLLSGVLGASQLGARGHAAIMGWGRGRCSDRPMPGEWA